MSSQFKTNTDASSQAPSDASLRPSSPSPFTAAQDSPADDDSVSLLILDEITRTMSASSDGLNPALEQICDAALSLLGVERSLLLLLDAERARLSVAAARGSVDAEALLGLEVSAQIGAFGRCLSARAPVDCESAREPHHALRDRYAHLDLSHFLAAPLAVGEVVHGVLIADRRTDQRPFQPIQMRQLMVLANLAALAAQNATLISDLRMRNTRLNSMLEITTALSSTLELDALFPVILQHSMHLTQATAGAILVLEGQPGLSIRVSRGLPDAFTRDRILRPGEGITGWVLLEGQSIRVSDVRSDPRYLEANDATRSELAVPIRHQGAVVGVINVESDQVGSFSTLHQQLLEILAAQAAVAMRNATLFHGLRHPPPNTGNVP